MWGNGGAATTTAAVIGTDGAPICSAINAVIRHWQKSTLTQLLG